MKITTTRDKLTGIVSVRFGGQSFSTGVADRADARRIARLAAQIAPAISKFALGGNIPVTEAVALWEKFLHLGPASTARNHLTYLRAWIRDAGISSLSLAQVTAEHVDKWVNTSGAAKLGTRRVKLSVIRSFFSCCIKDHHTAHDPSGNVRVRQNLIPHEQKETRAKRPFTDAEFCAVLHHIERRIKDGDAGCRFWRAALLLGRWSGLRLGDICQLEWACFKTPGSMAVWTDKRDRRVNLKITEQLAAAIDTIPIADPRYCFPIQRKMSMDHAKGRPLLSMQFARLCRAAGVEHTFHELRHTYATHRSTSGHAVANIASDLGHASTKVTNGYIH